jgi:Ca2+/Na+ antiporter
LIVLPASALAGGVSVPAGGVHDLVVSWLLAAALIPIFLIGRARLGRTSGIMLLVAYAVYAVMRVRGI